MSSVATTDTIFFTDDVDPPTIRAFNLGTRLISKILSYTMTDLVERGISPLHADGYNRTLRPRSMVFLDEGEGRASLYWADARAHVEKRQALFGRSCAWAAHGRCLAKALWATAATAPSKPRRRVQAPSWGSGSTTLRWMSSSPA